MVSKDSSISSDSASDGTGCSHATRLAPLLIVALTFAVYANSLGVPFVFDDHDAIESNTSLRNLWPLTGALQGPSETTVAGRPVLNLSFALNFAMSGTSVWSYHVANIFIHAACACLLFGVLRRTLESPRVEHLVAGDAAALALAATAIWTVHPLNTMSVTYIVQRAESLMGFFYVLTLYAFLRGQESPRQVAWQTTSVLAFLGGIGCKESIATAPLVIFFYDAIFLSGGFRNVFRRHRRYFAALALCWIPLALLVAAGPRTQSAGLSLPGLSVWEYFRTQPEVILHYLRLIIFPWPLCLDYEWQIADTWQEILLAGSVVSTLFAATAWGVAHLRPWSYLGVWFFGTLAVSSSVVPIIIVASEHRTYLPAISPIVIAVLGAWYLTKHWPRAIARWIRTGAIVFVIGVFSCMTFARNEDYRSELGMWKQVLTLEPMNYRAMTNYGALLEEAGQLEEALPYLERAAQLAPGFPRARYNFGVGLARSGRLADAVTEFQASVQLDPRDANAQYNLAYALQNVGQATRAEYHYREAIAANPNHAAARSELGTLLFTNGKKREAVEHLRAAVRIQSTAVLPRNTLAWILATDSQDTERDGKEAVRLAVEADRLSPNNPGILDTLAAAYAESGDFTRAADTARRAMEIARAANETALAAEIEARLGLYLAEKPFRSSN